MTTSKLSKTETLPKKQELIMDLLVARTRLGEPFWNFHIRFGKSLASLEEKGLLEYWPSIVEDHYNVAITEQGKKEHMAANYIAPILNR